MGTTYLYKFVRLGSYRGSAWFGVSDKVRNAYEDVVHEHARDGWRLVQIFAHWSPRSAPPGAGLSSRPEVLSVTQGLDEEERAELRVTLLARPAYRADSPDRSHLVAPDRWPAQMAA